jgi:DNA-binding transcriptional ArsR family regulator
MMVSVRRSEPAETPSPVPELPNESQIRAAVTAFSMLAEPTRLKLLWLISAEELDVTTLAERVGVNPSAVSQHLSRLRLCGLADTRKSGRHVLYRARDSHVRTLIAEALYHADHQVSGIPDHQ